MGHAKALMSLEKVDQQLSLHRDIVEKGLSVRRTEEMAKFLKESYVSEAPKSALPKLPYEFQVVQNKLSSHLGTKVTVKKDKEGDKGSINIAFYSKDDINRILEALSLL